MNPLRFCFFQIGLPLGNESIVDDSPVRGKIAALTPREHEVYERVAQGQANKVVAIELGISERTVELHRGRIMKKMRARSLAELMRVVLPPGQDMAK